MFRPLLKICSKGLQMCLSVCVCVNILVSITLTSLADQLQVEAADRTLGAEPIMRLGQAISGRQLLP